MVSRFLSRITSLSGAAGLLIVLFVMALALAAPLRGQGAPAVPEVIDQAKVAAALSETKADATILDEERLERVRVLGLVAAAIAEQKSVTEGENGFWAQKTAADQRAGTLKKELENPPPLQELKFSDAIPELERRKNTRQEQVATAKRKADEWDLKRQPLIVRGAAIAEMQTKISSELSALASEADIVGKKTDSASLQLYRSWLLSAKTRALRAELKELEAEDMAIAALTAQYSLEKKKEEQEAERQGRYADGLASAIQKAKDAIAAAEVKAKLAEDEAKLDTAKEELKAAPPELQKIAEETVANRQESLDVSKRIQKAVADNKYILEYLEKRKARFDWVKEIVGKDGRSDTLGLILRRERAELVRSAALGGDIAERQDFLHVVLVRGIELDEKINGSAEAQDNLLGMEPALRDQIERTFFAYNESLTNLKGVYNKYLESLGEVGTQEQNLAQLRDEFRAFVDQHVLWIASTDPPELADWAHGVAALDWLTEAQQWDQIDLIGDLRESPVAVTLAYLCVLLIFLLQRTIRNRQDRITKIVSNARAAPWGFTLQAWLLLIGRSLPWPLLVAVLAWRIRQSSLGHFPQALAHAMFSAGLVYFVLFFERRLCRKEGVAEVHFGWNPASLALFYRHFAWLGGILIPCIFVVRLFGAEDVLSDYHNSIGRFAFIVLSLALVVFAHIILRPAAAVMVGLKEKYLGQWINRLGGIWYLVVVGTPMLLAVLATLGYYYTALELFNAVLRSIVVLLIVMQANALVSRWIFLLTRRMAIRRAKSRRSSAGLAQLTEKDIEDDKLTAQDIKALRNEGRTLRRTAFLLTFLFMLYWIWFDILPAFNFFNTIAISEHLGGDGEMKTITLGNLLTALIIIAATIAAVRTLPALIEVVILRRLGVDRGGRYAVKALTRYFFVVVGLLWAFGSIGIAWGDVQWLVAGLSVGLGFGLQEIFANFMSGLIMLFERPVRVGDTVTVGDISGVVTRINMRATTVLDWDRKELIVPNKMFVTDRLINWSLSDDVVRVCLPVGVAYGSNIPLVIKTLEEIATLDKLVVAEPRPSVFFKEFGDSTLLVELRVFVHGVDNWRLVKHNLNIEIDRLFRERGIDIAFPQRVLHFAKDDNTLRFFREQKLATEPQEDGKSKAN